MKQIKLKYFSPFVKDQKEIMGKTLIKENKKEFKKMFNDIE